MNLFNKFKDFISNNGIKEENFYIIEEEESKIVSFLQQSEKESFKVTLAFNNGDRLGDIYTIKDLKESSTDLLNELIKINELNINYRGFVFYIENNKICLKSTCEANGNLNTVLKKLKTSVEISEEEFINFK